MYRPNRPYRRAEDGQVLTEEKIRIANIFIEVSDSYGLSCEVTSDYYDESMMIFSSEIANKSVVGVKSSYTGVYNYPFLKDSDIANITLRSVGYLGLTITNLRWRGQYTQVTTQM